MGGTGTAAALFFCIVATDVMLQRSSPCVWQGSEQIQGSGQPAERRSGHQGEDSGTGPSSCKRVSEGQSWVWTEGDRGCSLFGSYYALMKPRPGQDFLLSLLAPYLPNQSSDVASRFFSCLLRAAQSFVDSAYAFGFKFRLVTVTSGFCVSLLNLTGWKRLTR